MEEPTGSHPGFTGVVEQPVDFNIHRLGRKSCSPAPQHWARGRETPCGGLAVIITPGMGIAGLSSAIKHLIMLKE